MYIIALLAYLIVCASAQAQERAAIGTLDTQMSWSALQNQINSFNVKLEALNSQMQQVKACGKKGMVYAPGEAGADGQGCKEATASASVTNALNNLTTNQTTTTSLVNNIINCNKNGQIFNGTKCTVQEGVDGADTVIKSDTSTGVANNGSSSQAFGIPAGTREIIVQPLCAVRGSDAVATIQMNYGGSSYPTDLMCSVRGVDKNQTSQVQLSKVLRLPASATSIRIYYSSSGVSVARDMNVRIIYMK